MARPQPRGTEDADEEKYVDTDSVTFTEVGDSWARSRAVNSESEGAAVEGAAVAAPREHRPRVQRQTSPVYRTDLAADMLTFRKKSSAKRGGLTGNIGFLFGN